MHFIDADGAGVGVLLCPLSKVIGIRPNKLADVEHFRSGVGAQLCGKTIGVGFEW